MRLNYSVDTCSSCFGTGAQGPAERTITHIIYDTRKIQVTEGAVFFALKGAFREGEHFLNDALQKGVHMLVVPTATRFAFPEDATVWYVDDVLHALQELARYHRSLFKGRLIAVTGSVGKTTFKEWLFHSLQEQSFKVIRSPKSFNSQLGVALSLLELNEFADLAIIEAGISLPGEMARLEEMIAPDWGVLTALGSAHLENFPDAQALRAEKLKLFRRCEKVFVPETLVKDDVVNVVSCPAYVSNKFLSGYGDMLGVLKIVLEALNVTTDFEETAAHLPTLALRMEVFEGINGNTIINDTYNLDKDALSEALHVLRQQDASKQQVVILGIADGYPQLKEELTQLVNSFGVDRLIVIGEGEAIPWESISNAAVLVKAHRKLHVEREVAKGKARQHLTYVEINWSALKHNLSVYKSRLKPGTRLLSMVKADAYGTGAVNIGLFLQNNGIDYLGVAFADEGVELRRNGITLPIVVMNPDVSNAAQFIDFNLEPAIYSFEQLDRFLSELILLDAAQVPVHLKFDTGMHRLGFAPADKEKVLAILKAQPEVTVRGIYSHLADADNPDNAAFTEFQLEQFNEIVGFFRENLVGDFLAHVLNSEGALRYSDKALDMVRIGISMYGYTENRQLRQSLQPAVRWFSKVSQVKTVPAGDTIGYGRTFRAGKDMCIAIVPVGYADGFRRSLSNGAGAVYIQGKRCAVVGRVCMDMIMVDVDALEVNYNEEVEIIGTHQTMETLAGSMNTIPYEVLTGLSQRMQRVYVND